MWGGGGLPGPLAPPPALMIYCSFLGFGPDVLPPLDPAIGSLCPRRPSPPVDGNTRGFNTDNNHE